MTNSFSELPFSSFYLFLLFHPSLLSVPPHGCSLSSSIDSLSSSCSFLNFLGCIVFFVLLSLFSLSVSIIIIIFLFLPCFSLIRLFLTLLPLSFSLLAGFSSSFISLSSTLHPQHRCFIVCPPASPCALSFSVLSITPTFVSLFVSFIFSLPSDSLIALIHSSFLYCILFLTFFLLFQTNSVYDFSWNWLYETKIAITKRNAKQRLVKKRKRTN